MADATTPAASSALQPAEEAAQALACGPDEVHQLRRSLGFPRLDDGPGRLSQAADPGTVLLDEPTASAADGARGLWVSPSRPRPLQGVGTVRVSAAQVR